MIESIILSVVLLMLMFIFYTVANAMLKKQQILGFPSVPLPFFIMAKLIPFSMLVFLLLRGLKITVPLLYYPPVYIEHVELAFLIAGTITCLLCLFDAEKRLNF